VTTSTISGTLVSSSTESVVVRTDAGVKSTFTVDDGTALPANMTPGDRVTVEYHMLDGGVYLASRLALEEGSGTPSRSGASGSDSALPASAETPEAAGGTGSPTSSESGGELPRTASPLPLIAGIGVLAILAALGLRAIFRVQQPRV